MAGVKASLRNPAASFESLQARQARQARKKQPGLPPRRPGFLLALGEWFAVGRRFAGGGDLRGRLGHLGLPEGVKSNAIQVPSVVLFALRGELLESSPDSPPNPADSSVKGCRGEVGFVSLVLSPEVVILVLPQLIRQNFPSHQS